MKLRRWWRKPAPAPAGFATIALPGRAAIAGFHMEWHDGRDQVARAAAQGGWQSFEPPMPSVFLALVRRTRGLILDVGANTGFYALLAVCASRRARVVAFEPDAEVLHCLEANCAANPPARRITTAATALSDREGRAALYVPDPTHGLIETSASLDAAFKESHAAVHEVPVATLDGWLARHRPGRRVGLIKVDVEGHEARVLAGAEATIRRWRPVLFVEVLPRAELGWLSAALRRWNYADLPLRVDGALSAQDEVAFAWEAHNHLLVGRGQLARVTAAAKSSLLS